VVRVLKVVFLFIYNNVNFLEVYTFHHLFGCDKVWIILTIFSLQCFALQPLVVHNLHALLTYSVSASVREGISDSSCSMRLLLIFSLIRPSIIFLLSSRYSFLVFSPSSVSIYFTLFLLTIRNLLIFILLTPWTNFLYTCVVSRSLRVGAILPSFRGLADFHFFDKKSPLLNS